MSTLTCIARPIPLQARGRVRMTDLICCSERQFVLKLLYLNHVSVDHTEDKPV